MRCAIIQVMSVYKTIHILSPGFTAPNSTAFLMPMIKFKHGLRAAGFETRIFRKYCPDIVDCDFLFIDSKMHKADWAPDQFEATLAHIAALSAKVHLIWCDQGDSTGTFLGQVLPHVHRYLKAQLLRDRKEYLKEHYASRVWGEYYHNKYSITDEEDYIRQPAADKANLKKISVSWNSGLMHYGFSGPYRQLLREKLSFNALLSFAKPFGKPEANRPLDISCRMGIPYSRASMRYQREQIRKILKDCLATDKLSRRAYLQELTRSKICVSPFGLGEITLKDFECFLSGSLLFKPDMSHMETWPNFYEAGQTYLEHDWDLQNITEKIEWALSNERERLEIASAAQMRYCEFTSSRNAEQLFVEHFSNIIQSF